MKGEETGVIICRPQRHKLYSSVDMERRKTSSSTNEWDARDPFEKDLGRIIHSAAFRRLQSKTQVHGRDEGDFHRSRLTHSMEVAQIARGIVIHINHHHPLFSQGMPIDVSLIEAAALAHDLGHPPFGHRGEEALHECMRKFGGFEANAHTFRLLTRLEGERGVGLNLTRAMLLSILKYPIVLDDAINPKQYLKEKRIRPPKASVFKEDLPAFKWVLEGFEKEEKEFFLTANILPDHHVQTRYKTLECSIIDLADDIAYGTHDVEDAINLRFITLTDLKEIIAPYARKEYPEIVDAFEILNRIEVGTETVRLKKVFSSLISTMIKHVDVKERAKRWSSPRLRYYAILPDSLQKLLNELKQLVLRRVIHSQRVQTEVWQGAHMIKKLFDAMMNEERLLSEKDRLFMRQVRSDTERARIVCDYIAGMTDVFAKKLYSRLYGMGKW